MSAAGQLPEDEVLERIKKLLNLAAKNPNENEAASAAAKAQELLARYNLDAATVENSAAVKDGKREEAKVDGGFYSYQRELWDSVAKLNFCLYWTQDYRVFTRSKRVGTGRDRYTTEGHVNKKRHRLVGRIVNTRATIALAQYLEEAIERVTLERLGERVNLGYVYSGSANAVRFSNWAVSFRKGCAARIIEQVDDRREQMRLKEAERARRDAARAKRAGLISDAVRKVRDETLWSEALAQKAADKDELDRVVEDMGGNEE
jgi:hypothetical protein